MVEIVAFATHQTPPPKTACMDYTRHPLFSWGNDGTLTEARDDLAFMLRKSISRKRDGALCRKSLKNLVERSDKIVDEPPRFGAIREHSRRHLAPACVEHRTDVPLRLDTGRQDCEGRYGHHWDLSRPAPGDGCGDADAQARKSTWTHRHGDRFNLRRFPPGFSQQSLDRGGEPFQMAARHLFFDGPHKALTLEKGHAAPGRGRLNGKEVHAIW
jgi:hypothetical protein